MYSVLIRALCFVAIIGIGIGLRKLGFFRREDFSILAKLSLKLALPAAVISSFSGKTIDLSLLTLVLVGLGWNLIGMGIGYLAYRKGGTAAKAFGMINLPGYNIGNFALPFIQGFLGPMGVITASLFDTGNAMICLGGGKGFASMVVSGKGFSLKQLLRSLGQSPAFLTYMVMVILTILHIRLPQPVLELAGIIGSSNAFLAMLMLGVGFRLEPDREHLGKILGHLLLRYSLALVFALAAWFLLPFTRDVRQVLTVLAFSPISSAAPGFTSELGGDTELSSTVNSLSILISICAMVGVLAVTA